MGRLILWVAGIAGTLIVVSVLLSGPDAQSYRAVLETAILQSIKLQPGLAEALQQANEENLKAFVAFFVRMMPLFFAATWVLLTLGNMWPPSKCWMFPGARFGPGRRFRKSNFRAWQPVCLALA